MRRVQFPECFDLITALPIDTACYNLPSTPGCCQTDLSQHPVGSLAPRPHDTCRQRDRPPSRHNAAACRRQPMLLRPVRLRILVAPYPQWSNPNWRSLMRVHVARYHGGLDGAISQWHRMTRLLDMAHKSNQVHTPPVRHGRPTRWTPLQVSVGD
jgi:hypothetical protein